MIDTVAVVRHRGDLGVASRTDSLRRALQLLGGFGKLSSPFVLKANRQPRSSKCVTWMRYSSEKKPLIYSSERLVPTNTFRESNSVIGRLGSSSDYSTFLGEP